MSEDEKEELEMKAYSVIQLYLADEVLQEVADEDTAAGLWLKLEIYAKIPDQQALLEAAALHPSHERRYAN